jgi:lysophospholipase L1-like esterase
MKRLLFWGLLPLVFAQAKAVRRTAPRLSGAGGPVSGYFGSGPEFRLLAVGDSIIAGVGARDLSRAVPGQTASALAVLLGRRVSWSCLGKTGLTSREIRERLVAGVAGAGADLVLLSAGVNDITSLSLLGTWRRDLAGLLRDLRETFPGALIVMAGIPPLWKFPLLPQPTRFVFGLRARDFDQAAREVLGRVPGALYVPVDVEPGPGAFCPDGYHPSEESCTVIGSRIAGRAASALGQGQGGCHA